MRKVAAKYAVLLSIVLLLVPSQAKQRPLKQAAKSRSHTAQSGKWQRVLPPGSHLSISFPAPPVFQDVPREGGILWRFISLDLSKSAGLTLTVEYMKLLGNTVEERRNNSLNSYAYQEELERVRYASILLVKEYPIGNYMAWEGWLKKSGVYSRFLHLRTDEHIYIVRVEAKRRELLRGAVATCFFQLFRVT